MALTHVAGQIESFIDSDEADQRLKVERVYLRTALEDVQAMTATLTAYLMGSAEPRVICTKSASARCAACWPSAIC